jgi:hypothetical protein
MEGWRDGGKERKGKEIRRKEKESPERAKL